MGTSRATVPGWYFTHKHYVRDAYGVGHQLCPRQRAGLAGQHHPSVALSVEHPIPTDLLVSIVLLTRCSTILRILTCHSPSALLNEVYSASRCMTPGGGDMPRRCWPCATACLFIILLGFGISRAISQAHVLRFSDAL